MAFGVRDWSAPNAPGQRYYSRGTKLDGARRSDVTSLVFSERKFGENLWLVIIGVCSLVRFGSNDLRLDGS